MVVVQDRKREWTKKDFWEMSFLSETKMRKLNLNLRCIDVWTPAGERWVGSEVVCCVYLWQSDDQDMMEEVQKDVVEIQQEIHNALIVEDKELVSAWRPLADSVSVVLLFFSSFRSLCWLLASSFCLSLLFLLPQLLVSDTCWLYHFNTFCCLC